jgi:heavy metal sensor kinase
MLTAIVVVIGGFVVMQFRSELTEDVDRDVSASALQIAKGYVLEGAGDFRDVARTVLPRGSAAQILSPQGRVLHTHGRLDVRPIVSHDVLARALAGQDTLVDVRLPGAHERYRARVIPVWRNDRPRVLVVAESMRHVDASVSALLVLLLLAGPAALAATGLVGWWLARKALRPVDRMTSQAQEIGIDRLHERIAVPRAEDELGKLALTLNAMLDRLEQGVKDKQRLVADASHELRTPLAVMRAELDVSLRADDLPAPARDVLESTREEVDRMSRTVNNLLTLAQVDEGRLALLRERVQLADAIEAAARPLRPLAKARAIRLDVDGEPCEANADPQRLHQALTNYIENAIKFSEPGGSVRVTGWRRNGEVGVTVADDGPGIPPDAAAHVFERFYRVDQARGRDAGGSGLGLAICSEIAAAHGGRVWVQSAPGRGSAFSLALPRG